MVSLFNSFTITNNQIDMTAFATLDLSVGQRVIAVQMDDDGATWGFGTVTSVDGLEVSVQMDSDVTGRLFCALVDPYRPLDLKLLYAEDEEPVMVKAVTA